MPLLLLIVEVSGFAFAQEIDVKMTTIEGVTYLTLSQTNMAAREQGAGENPWKRSNPEKSIFSTHVHKV
jgi:hypothetical protein